MTHVQAESFWREWTSLKERWNMFACATIMEEAVVQFDDGSRIYIDRNYLSYGDLRDGELVVPKTVDRARATAITEWGRP